MLLLEMRGGQRIELEQLVRLGEALGATLDPKAIHQTVTQYLQPVVGQREIWMTVRTEGWKLAIGGLQSAGSSPEKAWDPTSQPGPGTHSRCLPAANWSA